MSIKYNVLEVSIRVENGYTKMMDREDNANFANRFCRNVED